MVETKIFTDERCLGHVVPAGFPECPARLEGIRSRLDRGPFSLAGSVQRSLGRDFVEGVHDGEYLTRFEDAVEAGHRLLDTADNPLSAGTWGAAWAAGAVAVEAAEWVRGANGEGRRGFAVVRPPGHHAEEGAAMGFCYLNNVALAAHFLSGEGEARLAIFDFDVHHGNGTQHLFEDRADVLFVSTHQYPFYPGTGAASEIGRGAGRGATLNLPVAAGTGDEAYLELFEEQVVPALTGFDPDVLLLSAGFDAWRGDPVGGLNLSEETFHRLGQRCGEIADRCCAGRVLAVLEGGYDLDALPRLVEAHLEGLGGTKADLD